MKNKVILIFLIFSFPLCQAKSINNKSVCSPEKVFVVANSAVKLSITEDTTESFVIVSHDYDFKSNYYGITIQKFKDRELKQNIHKVNLSPYKGVLAPGMYDTKGAYYPVQFNSDFSKLYISIYDANEMEGTFEWSKIIEYDLMNDSIREIAAFSDYFSSWYYSESNNTIYGFDTSSKSVISIDLESTKVNTIHSFEKYFEEIDYQDLDSDSLEILLSRSNENILKMTVDLATNTSSIQELYSVTNFSSYKDGKIVETFKDFRNGTEQLRLYSDDEMKREPFDFRNFNTYWINNNEFVIMKENKISKIGTDLKIIDEFKKDKIHIIDVLDNLIAVSYYEKGTRKFGLVDFDFTELIEVSDVNVSNIVLIKNIEY